MDERRDKDILHAAIDRIARRDPRYREEAYHFVLEAVEVTVESCSEVRHVSGGELLQGIRTLALRRFGPMAYGVMSFWGVTTTEDFGAIVFNLVEEGLLLKTSEDSIEDFRGGYDLKQALEEDYYRA